MNWRSKLWILYVLCVSCVSCGSWLLVATPAFALEIDAEELPDVYQSAYFLGRGNAGIAIADYEDALFYNPAGLALYEKIPLPKVATFQFKGFEQSAKSTDKSYLNFKRLVLGSAMVEGSEALETAYAGAVDAEADTLEVARDIVGENIHVGANVFSGLVLRNLAVGGFASVRGDALVSKDPDLGGLESAKARVDAYTGTTLGLADAFWENRILVGLALRQQYRGQARLNLTLSEGLDGFEELAEQVEPGESVGTAKGMAGDFGMILRSSELTLSPNSYKFWLGLTVRDVGGTRMKSAEEVAPDLDIPQTVHVGLGLDLGMPKHLMRLLVDFRDVTDEFDVPDYQKLHAGLEFWLNGHLGVQTGLHDGYFTGGLFLDGTFLRIEAGTYAEEMGRQPGNREDRRFYARALVGF